MHCRSQNLPSLASFCRLQDDDLAGATHHQFIILELKSLEATESYGRQRVGAPSTLHKSVRREAGFPPRSQGGDQSYPNVDIMLVVSVVSRATAVSLQSIICRATDESPGKISLSTRQPARSKVLICKRALSAKQLYQRKRNDINCTDRFSAALSTQTIISITIIDQRP